jgi:hypothetical protein
MSFNSIFQRPFYCKKAVLTGLWTLWVTTVFFAQGVEWRTNQISTESGLSNRFVNWITQDSRGYTWIATNFGLNRYDGHRIDILTRESHGLASNTIYELYPDSRKNIWVLHEHLSGGTINYIDVLDPISFQIRSLETYLGGNMPFAIQDVVSITPDTSGNLYILTHHNAIFRFDQEGLKRLIHVDSANPLIYPGISPDMMTTRLSGIDSIDIWNSEGNWTSRIAASIPGDIKRKGYAWKPIGPISPGKQLFVIEDSTVWSHNYYSIFDATGFSRTRRIPSALRSPAQANVVL